MRTRKTYLFAAIGALALLAASCGGGDRDELSATATESEPTTTEAAVTTTTAVVEESEPEIIEGVPSGMPNEYGGTILAVDSNNPPSPARGGFLVTLVGSVAADDGTVVDLQFSVYDFRAEGGSVDCGGETVEGAYTAQNSEISSGVIAINGWGKANIRIESTSHAFNAQLGEPFCDEQIGTWTGFEGELDGRKGTFHRLMIDGQEAISLG